MAALHEGQAAPETVMGFYDWIYTFQKWLLKVQIWAEMEKQRRHQMILARNRK